MGVIYEEETKVPFTVPLSAEANLGIQATRFRPPSRTKSSSVVASCGTILEETDSVAIAFVYVIPLNALPISMPTGM